MEEPNDYKIQQVKLTKTTLKKSNSLTEACYDLSVVEQKIMWAILAQIKDKDNEFMMSEISVKDLADFCHFKSKAKYKQIEKAAIRLLQRIIIIKKENGDRIYTHWIQKMRYVNHKNASLIFLLDQDLKDELLQLRRAFTVTNVKITMLFQSQYSIRIYDLLTQYLKIGHRRFLLKNLAEMFSLSKAYRTFANMRIRVIEPAVKEINELSDLAVEQPKYEKQGRKVVAVIFTFHKKPFPQGTTFSIPLPQRNEEPENEDIDIFKRVHHGMTEDEATIFDRLVTIAEINPAVASKLVKKYGVSRCRRNLEAQRKRKAFVKSLAGTVVRAIQEDWAGKVQELQEAQRVQQKLEIKQSHTIYVTEEEKKKHEEEMQRWKDEPLSDWIANFIMKEHKVGAFANRLKARGLTMEDVLAGKR